jgi:hypothetical protein
VRRLHSPRFVVLIGLVAVLGAATRATERSAASMAAAANQFVGSLSPAERQQAVFTFDSAERTKWHFIPTDMFPRNGLTIKSMSAPQRKLALDLLRTGLSQRGFMTATEIMDLENILRDIEAAARAANGGRGESMVRDPERYFFSVFGTPSSTGAWGWRVEGHHISLHFTVVNGRFVASSPTFFGVNPAEVRSGPRSGQRILGDQEDAARALVMALDPPRRAKAVINATAPGDILTMNQGAIKALDPAGILASDLAANQRDLLMKIVDAYVSRMSEDIAADRMDRLRKAGLEKIGFAWAGEVERGKKHYYRVQGPTFLIEFDNTQNDGNHIHAVWRDFNGDFGRDILREHLATTAH